MTDVPPDPDAAPRAPTAADAPAAAAEPRSYAPIFLKGCGWTFLCVFLGVGVVVASQGDFTAVGSALSGILILLVVLGSSGLTGFWGNKR